MNSTEALKIYDYLHSKGKEGAPLLTIAKETRIASASLKHYFQNLSKSFVRVGVSQKYSLNSFNSAPNQRDLLLNELGKYNQKRTLNSVGVAIAIGSAVFVSVMVVVSNGL